MCHFFLNSINECIITFLSYNLGMIHLNNLKSNNRVNLLYIVEADDERSKKVKASTGLETTQFVNCSEMDKVLRDPK